MKRIHAKNELDKDATVGGSNNAGVCRLSPQPPDQTGIRGQSSDAEEIFNSFFLKIRIFKHTLILISA